MRPIRLSIALAACLACLSCAGWPFNWRTPAPPEGLAAVDVYAVVVPEETFDRIVNEGMTYEDAADLWHRGPSVTIYFKEAPYRHRRRDPAPPADAAQIAPEGARYAVNVSGLRMHRFEGRGILILCGRGSVYYGKSLVEISPDAMSINGEAVEPPCFIVRSRELLDDAQRSGYGEAPGVLDIVLASDGRWRQGVQLR